MPTKTVVTFIFEDDEHFHRFLEKNQIDVYTYNWKKREFLVDLTSDIKTSMEATKPVEQPPAQIKPSDFL